MCTDGLGVRDVGGRFLFIGNGLDECVPGRLGTVLFECEHLHQGLESLGRCTYV